MRELGPLDCCDRGGLMGIGEDSEGFAVLEGCRMTGLVKGAD